MIFDRSAADIEPTLPGIKALTFDVQGTATDFWGTIVREGQAINRRKGLDIDWGKFADDWRALYRPGLDAVLNGERSWRSVIRFTGRRSINSCASGGSTASASRNYGSQSCLATSGAVARHDPGTVAPQTQIHRRDLVQRRYGGGRRDGQASRSALGRDFDGGAGADLRRRGVRAGRRVRVRTGLSAPRAPAPRPRAQSRRPTPASGRAAR